MPAPVRPAPAARIAFTLVEMLVVISVIAILTAVSVATIGMIREGAKLNKCSANLMRLGVGIHSYANDKDSQIPTRNMILGDEIGYLSYLGFSPDGTDASSYVKSSEAKCPKVWEYYAGYPGNSASGPNLGSTASGNWDKNAMYNVSVNLPASSSDYTGVNSLSKLTRMGKIRAPSQCAAIFDGDANWNNNNGVNPTDGPQYLHSSLIAKKGPPSAIVRDGRVNVLYFDGSVRALTDFTAASNAYDETKQFLRTSASSNVGVINQKRYQLFWNFVGTVDDAASWNLP